MSDRQSPPFGDIPGMIPGDHSLVIRNASTAVLLGGFHAWATGVLASLRTTTVSPQLQGLMLPIEQRRPDDPLTDLTVIGRLSDDADTAITANVGPGSQGEDRGIDTRHLSLWFPFEVEASGGDITFSVAWPAAGINTTEVTIPRADLLAGVSASIPVSSLTPRS